MSENDPLGFATRCPGVGCDHGLCIEQRRVLEERDAARDSVTAFLRALGVAGDMSDMEGWHYAADLIAERDTLRAEVARLLEWQRLAEAELDTYRAQIDTLRAEVARLTEDAGQRKDEIAKLTSEVLHERDKVEVMAKRADRFLARAEQAEAEVARLTGEQDVLRAEILAYTENADTWTTEQVAMLARAHADDAQSVDRMEAEVARLREALTEAQTPCYCCRFRDDGCQDGCRCDRAALTPSGARHE